ncbi:branched-chain amino acid permease (azaleucine resistance) [Halogeometricum borinquense DSM 11551]|uniref:Branched-chain amino acid permease (Azaleucine resistance) n=2 Tax=Halogeometricum borinquense TaxID=60847 RepID=E4NMR7_HALBP|nr:AzlC family ABC transporter permease [Halogeometricum borinquense]ADQ66222.1 predicted branched-chain amino acid permease (azaleucine resistance) [Halogeometricum borinquense DSM 11551]ELY27283.1 branched-chain amino acid permease (azaleucine resistance) [Halogeometricum borinquense DSM 11551]RYJ14749.1 branched-chain amino acid ABC transporter permease [Halogeometricum borinquense]
MSFIPPEVRRGVRDVSPILVGIIPFGLVAGVAAVNAGLSPLQAVGLSVVVFAGASQLAIIDLLGQNAELVVVFVTAVVINLRMMMYSASIAPHFRRVRSRWKAVSSYLLTDQAYALSIARYNEGAPAERPNSNERRNYYLAVAASLWIVWQVCTVLGILLGTGVPDAWGLEFAVPLVFLALLVPSVSNRPRLVAAVVGGGVAVAGEVVVVGGSPGLPFNLGLLLGALAGVLAGVAAAAIGDEAVETEEEVSH